MDYIYLDWNVIQYMKHSTVQSSIDGPEFFDLVKRLSKRYRFPFSAGHLKDLAKSFDPKNQDNVSRDLEYLRSLSQGYALASIEETDEICPVGPIDIYGFFKEIVAKPQADPEIEVVGESYSVDMKSLPNDDLFKPFLERSGGVLDSNVMSEFINMLWSNMDDPDCYKKFRQQVAEVRKKFEERKTIIDKESDFFKSLIPLLDFIVSKDPESYLSDFNSVIKSFCAINGRDFDGLKVGDKIELVYMLLDFHPAFRDRVNKKNRPSNMMRDCENLYFASQGRYYVTEDGSTFKKAEFVCKALSLRVKLSSMSGLLARFS